MSRWTTDGEPPAAAARDAADEGPRTYEQALNLDLQYETDGKQTIANALAFRDEFAAMLQRGFRVIKHAPHHKPKTHKLWLSRDGASVWWQPALDAGPPAAQFLVSDIHIILSYPLEPGQQKGAKFPTSKAPISADFHSFRLIFGRAIISRNGLEAWMFFSGTRARGTLTLKRR